MQFHNELNLKLARKFQKHHKYVETNQQQMSQKNHRGV